jgi:hypothetical protein
MTAHNVGALVVLKSGDEKQLAGIVTERGKHISAVRCLLTGMKNNNFPVREKNNNYHFANTIATLSNPYYSFLIWMYLDTF